MKFLRDLATSFYNTDSGKLSDYCFVFPNRRAGVFFKKYLGEAASSPFFSPAVLTIQELFTSFSELRQADKLDLIFRLYETYSKHSLTIDNFDDFYFWGEVILNDFDDTDKYLCDASKLFTNIKELKQIDDIFSYLSQNQIQAIRTFWTNFLESSGRAEENKDKFRAMWEILLPIYNDFKSSLVKDGIGYEGMVYRGVIDNLKDSSKLPEQYEQYNKIIFVGFSALNECEKELFRFLKRNGKGDFYWDYYGSILTDPNNKSTFFMESNIREFPSKMKIDLSVDTFPQIEIIGVPSETAQAATASQILDKESSLTSSNLENAVVLPDESLLLPVLYSIPENIDPINVTMGMPLRGTSVAALMESLIDFQKGDNYYLRVLNILKNNFVVSLESEASIALVKLINENNLIFVSRDLFNNNDLFKLIFTPVRNSKLSDLDNIKALCTYLNDTLDYLLKSEKLSKTEKEYVYYFQTAVTRISDLMIPMKYSTFSRVLSQITGSITVPFRGEPISGIQVMGILETRVLDFENMIFCSMNEGVYPVKSVPNSFIPANLRVGFSLPTGEHQDAILAYNFYRSIYRAKKVWLIYDTRTEGLISGEPSRYIYQLKYHFAKENKGLHIVESIRTYQVETIQTEPIIIEKSPEIIAKIMERYFSGGSGSFSASSLNTYIDCPLSFYYKYIAGLKEESEVEESIEANTFGTIFHDSVKLIYDLIAGSEITETSLKSLLTGNMIELIVEDVFKKEQKINSIEGHNKIIKELIIRYIRKVINYDIKVAPFKCEFREDKFEFGFKSPSGLDYKVYSKIDRIDLKDGVYKIIDYKTGKGENLDKSIEEYFLPNRAKKSNIMFQLLLYALVFKSERRVKDDLVIAPYILRDLVLEKINERIPSEDELIEFENRMGQVVDSLANPAIPFEQCNEDNPSDTCSHCPFINICNRKVNDKYF